MLTRFEQFVVEELFQDIEAFLAQPKPIK